MAATDDLRAEMETQIADLKKEIAKLSKSLSAKASDLMDDAEDTVEDWKGRANGAVRQMRKQAHVVTEAARENPGTAATLLSSAGLIGFVAGLVVGGLLANHQHQQRGRWY